MRRLQILGIIVALGVVVATAVYIAIPSLLSKPSPILCTGGAYNAQTTLIGPDELGKNMYNLVYSANGTQQSGLYYSFTSGALSWIKANTSSNAAFMNWWDYGKEITGCTGRSSVISNPSAQFIALGFTKNTTERDSNQSLIDVATALFTTNASLSKSIASKYGANYVFVTTEDGAEKAPYMLQLLGLKPADYLSASGATFNAADWTSLGKQTVIYQLLAGQAIPGFTQVYSDSYVKIFTVG